MGIPPYMPEASLSHSMSGFSFVSSSSSVMPQMPSYRGSKVRMLRLLSSLNTDSCENLEMPVRNTNRR